ncbi:MAG TPA: ATP-binding protein, partial [Gammaproteobacteria bacterium]|nr:ATP-binding protein [Gammaproteobacteria bacterium]
MLSKNSRVAKKSIVYLLSSFPCVVILGARQVGKSTLLQQIFPESQIYDLERQAVFQRLENDPELFLEETPRPLLIDEA